jgi:hypothetical protein
VLFNLFSIVELVVVALNWWYILTPSQQTERTGAILMYVWLTCGFFVQLLIAKVIVMFSKSTDNENTKEIWQCVIDHSIGHIRDSFDTKRAWKELREDLSLNNFDSELGESVYTDAEIELNKAILAGFLY